MEGGIDGRLRAISEWLRCRQPQRVRHQREMLHRCYRSMYRRLPSQFGYGGGTTRCGMGNTLRHVTTDIFDQELFPVSLMRGLVCKTHRTIPIPAPIRCVRKNAHYTSPRFSRKIFCLWLESIPIGFTTPGGLDPPGTALARLLQRLCDDPDLNFECCLNPKTGA